jgi:cell division transport system permease protein
MKNISRTFVMLIRVLKAGLKNFLRNSWLSIAATAVMVVALSIMLSAIVINITTRNVIKVLSEDLRIAIYLKDGVTAEQRAPLEKEISKIKAVVRIGYVSPQDAQKSLKEGTAAEKALSSSIELIGENALPQSIEVSLNDLSKSEDVTALAKQEKFKNIISEVLTGKNPKARNVIDKATSLQNYIIKASIFTGALFTGIAILIIFNTIRMAIFTRAEEIRIMKLIGATPSYIRGPFIVEACMYGVVAGFLSLGALYTIIFTVGKKLSDDRNYSETYKVLTGTREVLILSALAVGVGMLIGIVSSRLAMQKHLKLKRW